MDLVGLSLPLILVFWQWTTTTGAAVTYWTYTGSVGQSKWAEYFPDCGGKAQSPVDVATVQTQYDPSLDPLTPLGYGQHGNKPFSLYNNGHTVMVPLPDWMGVGGLPWQFTAVQMHLHWGNGAPGAGGSEHTINGQSTAAELHVVHYNSELYPNMSVAMTQQDGLAVLGVLIETGEEANPAYWNILNYLGRVRHAGQSVSIPAFDVQSLLPSDLGRYYRYNGSLTTPPCFQSVLWTLFTETVKISHTQMMKLETVLYASKEDADRVVMQDNYRTPQPLNDRTILSSFPLESVKVYTAGEITAIVIGALCGCVGLAVIIRFIVKTIRSTSSWDVLPSVRPAPVPRTKEPGKELKQDVALNTTSEPGKKEDPVPTSV
ncbi:carbonic anhydrase 14-like isoform X2 [Coregonus clupeaformis]|uniref:carbonic anhydrase 14-like isoform X2 n=1 Tax=Coregonus clupeaformis TaxID=59861 RepID=UPI001E1C2AC9|nr:carbonic anhydrase 14-like isoform X2 [Coregonus clupeaformis]